ncbi:MAG: hypothetical protein DRJ65_16105 [Acidobacteria bacterium]|nr:MAG: hypothetical protein DRJ65_16105 [Acidobacteriota bacterium]
MARTGKGTAPPENDLGGLRREPILGCQRARRALPGQAFFVTSVLSEGLPDEDCLTPHAPSERSALE